VLNDRRRRRYILLKVCRRQRQRAGCSLDFPGAALRALHLALEPPWIATVFVMDGSLKNFHAEQEQLEAEKKGREYEKRSRAALTE
jgi:hypothetical protein